MTHSQTVPVLPSETFCFDCSPDVPCFNACCRDLNQFLTPYDILQLKTHLGLTSQEFLARYTQMHMGPETGLPIVSIKPDPGRDRPCPFVTEKGCSVYAARPASCRTYPLMRAVSRSRETGRIAEHFMVLREPHCRGFETHVSRTPEQWLETQGAVPYNRYNDRLLEIISLKNRLRPGPLGFGEAYLFQMALYDLDAFRAHLFEGDGRHDPDLTGETLEAARSDDLALLELAMEWVKRKLFGDI
ncbi:MAG: YkgJ family cysteine cluster protein [Desulfobacterales bacterium]|nr:YkgJ family cysteine cluster protein [Desulfobacterales bacterium]